MRIKSKSSLYILFTRFYFRTPKTRIGSQGYVLSGSMGCSTFFSEAFSSGIKESDATRKHEARVDLLDTLSVPESAVQ